MILDRQTSTGVTYTVSGSAPRYTVAVTPDRAWLTDPARVFPVLLDPSTSFGTSLDLGCYVTSPSGYASHQPPGDPVLCAGNTGTDQNLAYGATEWTRHMYLWFGDLTATNSPVPADAVISDAQLTLTQAAAASVPTSAIDTQVVRVTQPWTSSITWATQPATDSTQQDRLSYTPPGAGSPVVFDPVGLVASWVHGSTPNYGLEIRKSSDDPNQAGNTISFYGFANPTHPPTLTVTWSPVIGQQSWVGAYDHRLSDRADLHVDLADRNLVVNGTDEAMAGPGQALILRRTYNSLSAAAGTAGAFGTGWVMNGGVDTGITVSRGQVTVTRTGGAWAPFVRNFTYPITDPRGFVHAPGVNADLVQLDSTHYTLSDRKSHVKRTFTLPSAGSTSGWLSKVEDGNGNAITYASSGSPLVTTSATDTTGQRSVGLTYTGGRVTAMAETLAAGATGARSWGYGYTGANLTSYTDPAGKVTRYCYTGALLTRMVTPRGSASGATCATTQGMDVTDIGYDATGHVTSVSYQNGTSPAITVGFAASTPLNPGGNAGATTETDPYGKASIYTYDTSDRVTKVTGPLGYSRTATFNTNNDVTASVSATNYTGGGSDPAVTSTYTGDNLSKITTPTGAAVSADYTGSETNQPNHVSDDRDQSAGNTTSATSTGYSYNGAGQLTSAVKGAATVTNRHQGESGVANCGPSGAAAFKGATCETRDADYNGTVSTARHRTLYSYDSLGRVVSMTPAQPDNSRTTPPASTYVYDGQSRVTKITDARGKVTQFSYDQLDRLTRTTYDSGTYTQYTWDEDGNKINGFDYSAAGVRSTTAGDQDTYDNLNRLATETAVARNAITQTWDGDSRLLTFDDGVGAGVSKYGYDDDGALTSMTEPGGDCTGYSLSNLPPAAKHCILFQVDKSGRRLRTVFPGDLAEQNQSYDSDGRISSITGTGQAAGLPTTLYRFGYSYLIGAVSTGHITSRTNLDGSHDDYTYGNEGRLSGVTTKTIGGTTTGFRLYCYDGNGNRTSTSTTIGQACPGGTTSSYDGANQQTGTGTGYDLAGDETAMPTALPAAGTSRASTWTDSQQLASVTLNGAAALTNSYYGASNDWLLTSDTGGGGQDNLRTSPLGVSRIGHKTSPGGSDLTVWYAERDPAGTLLGFRTYSGAHYYILSDNLRSTSRVVDTTGAAVDAYSYDPYGTQTTTINTVPQPFGYTSAYTQPTTGLIHLGARWYDPTQGRFTQPDPHTHPADVNQSSPYPYTGDDPINHTDPSGADVWSDLWGGAEIVAGGIGLVSSVPEWAACPATGFSCGLAFATDVVSFESISNGVSNVNSDSSDPGLGWWNGGGSW